MRDMRYDFDNPYAYDDSHAQMRRAEDRLVGLAADIEYYLQVNQDRDADALDDDEYQAMEDEFEAVRNNMLANGATASSIRQLLHDALGWNPEDIEPHAAMWNVDHLTQQDLDAWDSDMDDIPF